MHTINVLPAFIENRLVGWCVANQFMRMCQMELKRKEKKNSNKNSLTLSQTVQFHLEIGSISLQHLINEK